ncbi:MAG: hypothetical protein H6718_14075 [Polyangiaceae bacterium]|nr:hypothetical protein [Polyangiaceae bacterium]MCB9606032.1 hypothetical protein [Polyangiaceae bacterium]
MSLLVESLGPSCHVANRADLYACLKVRFGESNHFWLSCEDPFPSLAVAVRDALASLHYFPEESHPGFICLGNEAIEGTQTLTIAWPRETIEVENRYVVSWQLALEAAEEFLVTQERPRCLQWFEL